MLVWSIGLILLFLCHCNVVGCTIRRLTATHRITTAIEVRPDLVCVALATLVTRASWTPPFRLVNVLWCFMARIVQSALSTVLHPSDEWMNSGNDFVMMTASKTLSWVLILVLLIWVEPILVWVEPIVNGGAGKWSYCALCGSYIFTERVNYHASPSVGRGWHLPMWLATLNCLLGSRVTFWISQTTSLQCSLCIHRLRQLWLAEHKDDSDWIKFSATMEIDGIRERGWTCVLW